MVGLLVQRPLGGGYCFVVTTLLADSECQPAQEVVKKRINRTETYRALYSVLTAPRTIALGKTGHITVYEVDGVSRNDDGGELFNNMAVRCLGESLTIGGNVAVRGACVQIDKDGDQLFIRYEATMAEGSASEGGTEHYVGGTGKYLGFAGKADFTA